MQVITSTQQEALNSDIRDWKVRVTIYRNDFPTVPIDLTDRVQSLTISGDLNSRNFVATIVLNNVDFLLSPTNENSNYNLVNGNYNPLIYPYHKVVIEFGIKTTIGYEYWTVFTGITGDSIEPDIISGTITISVRDNSKILQDAYIFLSCSYDYDIVENVIRDILLTNGLGSIVFESEPTNFLIQHFQIKDDNCWNSIQKLADLMGWILSFNEVGVLKLKSVNNSNIPITVFNEDDIVRETLTFDDSDIRNDICVRVQTPDSGIVTARVEDADSIREFGRRFMQVDRSLSSYIWSYDQAYRLACAILRDLKDLPYTDRIELPLYPPIQLDDVIAIESNKSGLRNTNLLKVVSVEHRFSETEKRTTLVVKRHVPAEIPVSPIPNPPTDLTSDVVSHTIDYYSNCGWEGKKKVVYYPKIAFAKPTLNTDNTKLDNLNGYILERSPDNVNFKGVRYFFAYGPKGEDILSVVDYSCPGGVWYFRLVTINAFGIKSDPSSSISVNVPDSVIYV